MRLHTSSTCLGARCVRKSATVYRDSARNTSVRRIERSGAAVIGYEVPHSPWSAAGGGGERLLHATTAAAAASGSEAGTTSSSTVLYVSNLASGVKGSDLTAHFEAQPGFESAFMMEVEGADGKKKESLGFVQFASAQAAAAAQSLDGSLLGTHPIRVRADKAAPADSSSSSSSADATAPAPAPAAAAAGAAAAAAGTSSTKTKQPRGPKPSPRVLFVRGLPAGTTEEQLAAFAGTQPEFKRAWAITRSRGAYGDRTDGWLCFEDEEAAAAAMTALNGTEFAGSAVTLTPHAARTAKAESSTEATTGQQPSSSSSDGAEKQQQQQQRPPKKQQPKQKAATVDYRVGNLPFSVTSEQLREHFKDSEGVVDAFIVFNTDKRPSGWGFVKFESEVAAGAVVQALDGSEFQGRTISLRPATRKGSSSKSAAAPDAASDGGSQPEPAAPASNGSSSSSANGSAHGAASASSRDVRSRLGREAWALAVANLSWQTTDEELRAHFADCQGLEDAFITLTSDGRPSGRGFLRFASAEAMTAAMAKQGSVLGGRQVELLPGRPGRIETPQAAAGSGRRTDPLAGAAAEETRVVLYGLPPSFSFREVLGLCSVFGHVNSVKRSRSAAAAAAAAATAAAPDSSDGSTAGGDAEAAEQAASAAQSAAARKGQPAIVFMNKPEAAVAAVLALNGRMVQGCLLAARLFRPGPPEEKAASKAKADKEAAAGAIQQRRKGKQQRAEAAEVATAAA